MRCDGRTPRIEPMLLLVLVLSFLSTRPPDRRGVYQLGAGTILYPLHSSTMVLPVLLTMLRRSKRTDYQLGLKAGYDYVYMWVGDCDSLQWFR